LFKLFSLTLEKLRYSSIGYKLSACIMYVKGVSSSAYSSKGNKRRGIKGVRRFRGLSTGQVKTYSKKSFTIVLLRLFIRETLR